MGIISYLVDIEHPLSDTATSAAPTLLESLRTAIVHSKGDRHPDTFQQFSTKDVDDIGLSLGDRGWVAWLESSLVPGLDEYLDNSIILTLKYTLKLVQSL